MDMSVKMPDSPEKSLIDDSSAAVENISDQAPPASKISKRQKKRLERAKYFAEHKQERRAKEREKKKEKRRAKREAGEDLGPSRNKMKQTVMASSSCKVRVVVDCSFDDLMSEKVVMELVQQLQYCYSANRRATNPVQFHVAGIGGKTLERLENIGQYKQWDVNFSSSEYSELFKKEDVVYLSSESENVLEHLEDSKVYIIGGLVDHNHHKGLCHKLASEKGLAHARLPINDFLHMKSRHVLTINHVFEILLRFTESSNWKEAFLSVLPARKGAKSKSAIVGQNNNSQQSSESQDS